LYGKGKNTHVLGIGAVWKNLNAPSWRIFERFWRILTGACFAK
jgi:hypothetical protein